MLAFDDEWCRKIILLVKQSRYIIFYLILLQRRFKVISNNLILFWQDFILTSKILSLMKVKLIE